MGMRSVSCRARRHPAGRVKCMLRIVLCVAGLSGLAACTLRQPERAPVADLVPALEGLVRQTAAAEPQAPAVLLHVQAPRLPLRWQGGAGPGYGMGIARLSNTPPSGERQESGPSSQSEDGRPRDMASGRFQAPGPSEAQRGARDTWDTRSIHAAARRATIGHIASLDARHLGFAVGFSGQGPRSFATV